MQAVIKPEESEQNLGADKEAVLKDQEESQKADTYLRCLQVWCKRLVQTSEFAVFLFLEFVRIQVIRELGLV